MQSLARIVATTFYSGYSPVAPGTVGALITALFLYGVGPVSNWIVLLTAVVLLGVGVWASDRAERDYGPDAGRINIDEVVGMLMAAVGNAAQPVHLVVVFLLFRLFDIVKPFPANRCQQLPGGWGVMADDVVAGVYANLAARAGRIVLGF